MKSTPSIRGSDAVKSALIKAASQLLAEFGPRSVSVREVARQAGVNHAQVHHYFGSKRALLKETMRTLAAEHFQRASENEDKHGVPRRPLAVQDDWLYWRSLCQAILADDMDLARTEIQEDISVPQKAIALLEQQSGAEGTDVEKRAPYAAAVALVLGWTAFETLILNFADLDEDDREPMRREIDKIVDRLLNRLDPTED